MKNHKQLIRTFQTAEELAENLAEEISCRLQEAVTARNRAVLVVSGGTTPKPLFIRLAQKEISWNRVTITLADERWVDTADPSSNEQLVRTYLLQDKAEAADFNGLKNDNPTAASGEKECHERLTELPRPFDVVILGMGLDGHTASLFPGSPGLLEAMDRDARTACIAMTAGNATPERISMTVPKLLDARQIFLHITGEEKINVLEQALAGGSVEEMPIRSILLQHQTPVQIFWAP